ncbi:MAG: adenylosuccinate lyase [Planctomycetota bacterium]|nr:MAG: adenylosuccinate lyase [Planctomycetota bacterium]
MNSQQPPDSHNVWENPLATRYASAEMASIWSDNHRYRLWRQMWLALAEAEAKLGLPISQEQLEEMRAHLEPIDFVKAAEYEKQTRHDVFAHLHTFGDACPKARSILHLGATSAFVTDNTDLILIRESLELIAARLAVVIERLAQKALATRDIVCLGLTHLQPAQPTTIGKRICLWIHDLIIDLEDIDHRRRLLRARGVKGTTGTQASFLELFAGDHAKVRALDEMVSQALGFSASYDVTGQTYTRKIDSQVVSAVSGIAESTHKAGNDLRLSASFGELEEPFEADQVGSSAMPYKRNPMRAERMCGLARFVMGLTATAAQTAAVQWFERTLDDSAPRRLVLPQAFLATDAQLVIYANIAAGLVVLPGAIAANLAKQLPFLASERILMAAAKAGGDRQELHESMRRHSHAATAGIRQGSPNDLVARLAADPLFAAVDFQDALESRGLAGRASAQVEEFISGPVQAALAAHPLRASESVLRV